MENGFRQVVSSDHLTLNEEMKFVYVLSTYTSRKMVKRSSCNPNQFSG